MESEAEHMLYLTYLFWLFSICFIIIYAVFIVIDYYSFVAGVLYLLSIILLFALSLQSSEVKIYEQLVREKRWDILEIRLKNIDDPNWARKELNKEKEKLRVR